MSFSRKFSAEALSIAGGLVIIGFLLRLSYDAAIVAAAVACFIIGAVFRPRRLVGWIPALVVSLTWIAISGDMYAGYNVFKLHILGITAFPIIAWPTALAFAYLYLVPLVQAKPWPRRWLYLAAVYSVGIIAAEWLGYHLLGVHLEAGKAYPGWPILDIFHCPWWMQLAYFANGTVFMGMASWMERKQDHHAPTRTAGAWWRQMKGGSETVTGS
ncbi:MAG: hypothetical protein CVV51_01180 [Spirochaetae bacterium HGW-Spirochaetae-7]|jgi:hypothetical protein|nr:MAG: hypothetical protein CVV51_01180 [Spirochaetae bacterium HGW-Spirochaetae-7]